MTVGFAASGHGAYWPFRLKGAPMNGGNMRTFAFMLIAMLAAAVAVPTQLGAAEPTLAQSRASRQRKARDRLVQKVLEISRLPSFKVEVAVAILGSRRGRHRDATEYRREWPLSANDLIVEGSAYRFGEHSSIRIEPRPALGLALQDFDPLLLDVPFNISVQRAHPDADSYAIINEMIYYSFRIPGGELRLTVPTTPGNERHGNAYREAWDTAKGRARWRIPVIAIHISDRVDAASWEEATTLRKFRATPESPPAQRPTGAARPSGP
jgi:hypothetical protein